MQFFGGRIASRFPVTWSNALKAYWLKTNERREIDPKSRETW